MEEIGCIFCQNHSDSIVIEENGFKGRKCSSCGLIYISPRPTSSEILALYSDDQDRGYKYANSHIGFENPEKFHAKHTLAIIKTFMKRGSILELGAGAGYFLSEAKKQGFEVFAIEPNKIESSFINNTLGIPCEMIPLNKNSFGGKKFNVIYHCNVLSHFHDPINQFIEINDTLDSTGIMVFETGNLADVDEKYYKYYPSFDYPDHLFFFGESTINRLLECTGFELLRIYKHSIMLPMLIKKLLWNLRGSLREKTNLEMLCTNIEKFSFKRLLRNYYRWFRVLLVYKLGPLMPKKGRLQTVIVVARKKQ